MIVENQITKKRFEVTPEQYANMQGNGVNKYDIIEDDAPMEVKSMREQVSTKKATKINQKSTK